jgi:hypothetical protein
VAERESPPRSVDLVSFIIAAYRGALRPMLFLLAFVVFDLVFVSRDTRLSSGQLAGFLLFFGAIGVFFLFFPAFAGVRSAGWATRGLVASADVLDARSEVIYRRTVVGRRKRSVVVGRRVVHHPRLGDYEDEFSVGDPWRESIRMGGRLEVLVAPTRPRTWITLGVEPA